MKRILIISFGVIVLLAAGAAYLIFLAPNSFEGDRFILVSKGENFSQVTDSLQKAGVLRSRLLFQAAGRLRGWTTRMQIGKYRFRSGMSNYDILADLRTGKTVEAILVGLPSGAAASRISRLLARRIGIDSARFMALVHDSAFARTLNVNAPSLEGYLLPDSYQFLWQADEESILQQMVASFWQFFNDSLRAAATREGLSVHDVVTMASIVEGETAVDSERAIIAGVYYNRLRKKMRLEADPTIEYIIADGPRMLRYTDLQIRSPYNTYMNAGLPPGPISNPGKGSILAAIFPRPSRYLFFVANGEGGHRFSVTYNQHRAAVKKLRLLREFRKLIRDEEG